MIRSFCFPGIFFHFSSSFLIIEPSFLIHRQQNPERRSLALFAFDLDPAAMGFDDRLAVIQADPHPLLFGRLEGTKRDFSINSLDIPQPLSRTEISTQPSRQRVATVICSPAPEVSDHSSGDDRYQFHQSICPFTQPRHHSHSSEGFQGLCGSAPGLWRGVVWYPGLGDGRLDIALHI